MICLAFTAPFVITLVPKFAPEAFIPLDVSIPMPPATNVPIAEYPAKAAALAINVEKAAVLLTPKADKTLVPPIAKPMVPTVTTMRKTVTKVINAAFITFTKSLRHLVCAKPLARYQ